MPMVDWAHHLMIDLRTRLHYRMLRLWLAALLAGEEHLDREDIEMAKKEWRLAGTPLETNIAGASFEIIHTTGLVVLYVRPTAQDFWLRVG